jgi:hypothetical protein
MLKRLQIECDLMGLERSIASYEGILLQLKDLLSSMDGRWDDVRSLVRKGRVGRLLDREALHIIISARKVKNAEYNRKRRRNE